jgi:gamma-glutamyltranspeptidase / glutathione hydrolase
MEARRFPSACVASPHHLATAAGLAVLASGGNALDAAVATNLMLGVVTPYLCGYGGDLFALIWNDGLYAYNGSGRAPAAATVEAVRDAAGSSRMPTRGPLAVTVPGAVEAWFALLERFGTRTFATLAEGALRFAREGFPLSREGAERIARARESLAGSAQWRAVYDSASTGRRLIQSDLARTIEALRAEGPAVYYRGPIAEAIASHIRALGGLISPDDLAQHRGDWVQPVTTTYRDVDILELPPNTQGVAVLEALNIVQAMGQLPADGTDRQHLLIEAIKWALTDLNGFVTDPDFMRVPAERLSSTAWAKDRAKRIDRAAASDPVPGPAAAGGTAYLCAADGRGMCVSLIQSNYMGFGSGVTVPGWGINLQNRGAMFSLDPSHANAIAPRKRTLHTLIPAMALRGGRPWLTFGTMGGIGQAQTHLQLLARIVDDGDDIQRAIDAPRWFVSPEDWSVTAESRFEPSVVEELQSRGHRVQLTQGYDSLMGHAHAIEVIEGGYAAATDPRTEGAVLGL